MATVALDSKPRVLMLGAVALAAETGAKPVPGQQGHVLALLAGAFPDPVPSDALIDELWPARPPRTARTGLRVVITRLRERLGEGEVGIVHESGSYRLTTEPFQLDHLWFGELLAEAEAIMETDPGTAAARLLAALELWRADAFQPYGEQGRLVARVTSLDELRRQAEELLVEAFLEAGRPDNAAAWANRFVETDPYRERRWEQLMIALYRCGRQAEAVRTGQRATATLREDLGIEPGPVLRELERDILNQAPTLAGPAPSPPGPAEVGEGTARLAAVEARELRPPRWSTSFLGREEESARLAALSESASLVTVTGPPGVGKTRLAAQHALGVVDTRVVWVDLVPHTARMLLVELAGRLGVRLVGRDAAASIAATIDEPLLLVLDNCEHLVDPLAELVEALLAASSTIQVLATSRTPLACPSEQRLDLAPLPPEDGMRLLIERASLDTTSPADLPPLAELAAHLDGVPLAIELVAPALATTAPRHLADQLTGSLDIAAGRGRPDPRHRSLAAAVDWSLELLSAEDLAVFDVAGVMHGGFSVSDLAQLAARPTDELLAPIARLASSGLVRPSTLADRQAGWRLPSVVRVHARSRLAAADALERWDRSHAELHLDLVHRLAGDLVGPEEDRAVVRLARSADQLRGTHAFLLERGEVEASAAFTLGLWDYHFFRLEYGCYHWLRDTLTLDGIDDLSDLPELLAEASLSAWASDDFLVSSTLADRAHSVARTRGQPVPLAAIKAQFNVAAFQARFDDAAVHLERLVAESRQRGTPRERSDALVSMVLGLTQLGSAAEAERVAARSVELALSTGNPTSVAWAQVGLGSAQLVTQPRRRRSLVLGRQPTGGLRSQPMGRRDGSGGFGHRPTADGPDGAIDRPAGRGHVAVGSAHAVGLMWRGCQEAVLLLAGRGDRPAAARLLTLLDMADHVHPMLPDDQARLDALAVDLRQPGFDIMSTGAGATDGDEGPGPGLVGPHVVDRLAAVVVSSLRR